MQQVVTIHPDGSISGLQRKQGLDLRKFGKAQIERTSDIVWSEDEQKWWVKFLRVEGYLYISTGLMYKAFDIPASFCVLTSEQIEFFDEYEQAVYAEIKVLDYLRLKGLLD